MKSSSNTCGNAIVCFVCVQEMKHAWLQGVVASSGQHSASSRIIWVWTSVTTARRSSGPRGISHL